MQQKISEKRIMQILAGKSLHVLNHKLQLTNVHQELNNSVICFHQKAPTSDMSPYFIDSHIK